jgi:uncharacterized protein
MYYPKILIDHLDLYLEELKTLILDETMSSFSEKHKKELELIQSFKNSLEKLNENFHITVEYIKNGLDLATHPEGGFYREFIRNTDQTTIFYLLPKHAISSWHSLKDTKEEFKLILGESLIIEKIGVDGIWKSKEEVKKNKNVIILKSETDKEFGDWFGAYTNGEYGLVTCKCTGPFEFGKFKLLDKENLNRFHSINPERKKIIDKLTPENLKEKTNFLQSFFQICFCCKSIKKNEEQESLIDPSQNNTNII